MLGFAIHNDFCIEPIQSTFDLLWIQNDFSDEYDWHGKQATHCYRLLNSNARTVYRG